MWGSVTSLFRARLPRVVLSGTAALALMGASSAFAADHPLGQVVIDHTGVFATPLAGVQQPIDAVPTRDAGGFYFLATGDNGPGVFLVSHAGGRVIAVRSREPGAQRRQRADFCGDRSAGDGGEVAVLDTFGGGVMRTFADGYQPRGVDISLIDGHDLVYFSGVDPADGQPGVFRSAWDGSDLAVVAKGQQLKDPSGVAVTADGTVYVSDAPGARGDGRVFKAAAGTFNQLLGGLWLGTPGGVALTTDGATLAVSALTPATGGATVVLVNTATGAFTTRDDGISQNHGAGGVHRARSTNIFGWADVSRSGRVYRIDP